MCGLVGMPELRNYRMTVAYDGTEFAGYQIQEAGRTVQGTLESALAKVTRCQVRIAAAGRTDAGVHALGQVVSFHSGWRHTPAELERAVNALLPPDVSVRSARVVEDSFHARYSALSRKYLYRIYQGAERMPLLDRYAWRRSEPLREERLAIATEALVGEADFGAFGKAPDGGSTVRHVLQATWSNREDPLTGAPMWMFAIQANGFLRGMVRRIVGTLVQVGEGSAEPDIMGALLAQPDPARTAAPAPAQGLFMVGACYAESGAENVNVSSRRGGEHRVRSARDKE